MGAIEIVEASGSEVTWAAANAVTAFSFLKPHLGDANWSVFSVKLAATVAEGPSGTLLVAKRDGRLLGNVRYTGPGHPGHALYAPDRPYIRALAIAPDALRQGVAEALTKACIERACASGAAGISLHVADMNAAALALYRKLGFVFHSCAPFVFSLPYSIYNLEFSNRTDPLERRLATAADMRAAELLYRAAFTDYVRRVGRELHATSHAWIEEAVGQEHLHGWFSDGGLKAFASLVEKGDGTLELDMFAVAPALQGSGLGRRILTEIDQIARQRGYARIELLTAEVQDKVIRFYEAAGFEIYDRGPSPHGRDNFVRVFMRKAL